MKERKMKQQMKTPITYYGGKQTMLKHILPLVPKHTLYTEAFAGGAALFFAKERATVEVINDLNGEIINFYETVVTKFDELKANAELVQERVIQRNNELQQRIEESKERMRKYAQDNKGKPVEEHTWEGVDTFLTFPLVLQGIFSGIT